LAINVQKIGKAGGDAHEETGRGRELDTAPSKGDSKEGGEKRTKIEGGDLNFLLNLPSGGQEGTIR